MTNGEDSVKEGLHAEDAADQVISPREIDLHLEDQLGIHKGRSGDPALDQLELLVDPLALLLIQISEEVGISKAISLEGIRRDHSPLEAD